MAHPFFDELREKDIKHPNGNSFIDIFDFSESIYKTLYINIYRWKERSWEGTYKFNSSNVVLNLKLEDILIS